MAWYPTMSKCLQGQTPLMLACQAGEIDLVKSLLKRNTKVRVRSHQVNVCCQRTILQSLVEAQCAVVQLRLCHTWSILRSHTWSPM